MSESSINQWIQLATTLAILAGLGLVIWELNQARTMTQVEMSQGTMSDITQDFTALYGDNAAATLARACFRPGEVTEEDAVVLDFFFWTQTYRTRRLKLQVDVAGFNPRWHRAAEFSASFIAGFPQGKAWLAQFDATDKDIEAIYRRAAAAADGPNCRERYTALLPPKPNQGITP